MNGNVIIKSFPNGISVKLSDEPDFEKILQDTKNSFEKTASFFKNASIVLRFEGRSLKDTEIEALTEVITKVSQINIICVVCTNKNDDVYITHTDNEKGALFLLDKLKEKGLKGQCHISIHEPMTGSHLGPGSVALFFKGIHK